MGLAQLWGAEWTTYLVEGMNAAGTLEFDGFYGTYEYALRSGGRECSGSISSPGWSSGASRIE